MDGVGARDELAILPDARTPALRKGPTHDYNGIPAADCDAMLAYMAELQKDAMRTEAVKLGITLEG